MLKKLEAFLLANKKFQGKGPLCVALVMTDHARQRGLPLAPEDFVTVGEGQVLGLGKGRVQIILARHGVTRILAEEGGRTSRGSMGNMRAYVTFLNQLYNDFSPVDLDVVEGFWVAQVLKFFAGKPFSLRLDESLGLRAVIRNLLLQAEVRQKEMSGSTFQGTMLQHLVGAKLDLVLGIGKIQHHGANQNDAGEGRSGDFVIEDVCVHVSTAPGEALIRKCQKNLEACEKPIIVTTAKGASTAQGLADFAGIEDRLDIIEIEQFLATNIYELGVFEAKQRRVKIEELVARYNVLIDEYETDPSLCIDLPHKR
ncbi:MAG: DUF4928 family protein [Desulfomicrobium sp.]|nr:DUF4928 family protein [Pseudomonadota bacterium]MBV1710779.1 DUF4928 family protein [Desulfomicrobium sp.]MBU4570387.1 DUF4928 family protein [Pseudomonadota bacterium]MBU4593308.1 DUF4928 family protein [Pseudomonadota bacterium]MBV1721570.1 DUF4928 family protein [Desulfomicrobium sp.]